MLRRLYAPRAAGLLRAALPPLAPRVALPARSLSTAVQRVQPSTRPPPPPIELNRSAALLLQMPTEIGPFALNNIRDNIGARRKTRRLGRGVGSGRGRKLGRGQKGLKSRAGNHGLLKSDGGQTKLTKRVPKRGFHKPKKEYCTVYLDDLEEHIRSGRLKVPEERPITVKDFYDAKLITHRQRHSGIELLTTGRNQQGLVTPLRIEAQRATHKAIAQVEDAGGSIETVYYSKLNLRALLKPEKFDERLMPRPALPPPKEMIQYMREDKRGYLRNLQPGDVVRPHEHPEHVDMSLTRPTEMAPGFNHHTKSLRRLKKEAYATAEAARLEADIANKEE